MKRWSLSTRWKWLAAAATISASIFFMLPGQPANTAPHSNGIAKVLDPSETVPEANPIVTENQQQGTTAWRISGPSGHNLEGFASSVSAVPDSTLDVYVSSNYETYSVLVFRLGWYRGHGGRLLWRRASLQGHRQAPQRFDTSTHMVEVRWSKSFSVPVGADWTTGYYVIALRGPEGRGSYIPFIVKEASRKAPLLAQASVTTWQAYNAWGGTSLYNGTLPWGQHHHGLRADVVSFDRPYATGNGAGNLFTYEFAYVSWLEAHGFDVGYTTDIDTHTDPQTLKGRKAFLSLGHDEYWSSAMRSNLEAALGSGVSAAFLGANDIYRHIRLEPSWVGPNRHEVNYRSTADPLSAKDPRETTVQWRDSPVNQPEDAILGEMYECNPVHADLVVNDTVGWLFEGTADERIQRLIHNLLDHLLGDRTSAPPGQPSAAKGSIAKP
ncbi:MAG: hypothetical protein LC723_03905 [Actinobacteria bacterium]|nr:hypothetical protein [Actinomycetota bacterium]